MKDSLFNAPPLLIKEERCNKLVRSARDPFMLPIESVYASRLEATDEMTYLRTALWIIAFLRKPGHKVKSGKRFLWNHLTAFSIKSQEIFIAIFSRNPLNSIG